MVSLGMKLVMRDESNPRSLSFQLERLLQHLAELPKVENNGGELEPEERALLEAMTSLKLSRLPELLATASTSRQDLDILLGKLDTLLKDFSRFISDKHFDHRSDPQQLLAAYGGGL